MCSDALSLPALISLVKLLSFRRLDELTGRTAAQPLGRQLVETVMLVNMGAVELSDYVCPPFTAAAVFSIPVAGNAYVSMYGCGEQLHLTVGLPDCLAGDGRMDAFIAALRAGLAATEGDR